ncbi:MAG: hypothetical protein E6G92_13920 [Alphaproteobacteria bacterium]|nr:MAG: hypothetical protein E6G92_13920 [Alphaproteobacteria bacterium]
MDEKGVPGVKPHRQRHDGFTPKKQRRFFKALGRTGCLSDAARKAGISRNTVRRHRIKWPDFEAKVQAALAMAATELETIAWKRAVEGVPEVVIRDGKVAWIKIKPSDAILRLLLQGANPKKYGRTGGAGAVKPAKSPRVATNAEVREALAGRLAAFRERVRAEAKAKRRIEAAPEFSANAETPHPDPLPMGEGGRLPNRE